MVFWLFTRALFDDPFRLRWWHALLWAALAAFSFVNCTVDRARPASARISIIAINLLVLGFIALAVRRQTLASWSADLRRGAVAASGSVIVSAAALYGCMNAISQTRDFQHAARRMSPMPSTAPVLAFESLPRSAIAMMRVDGRELFAATAPWSRTRRSYVRRSKALRIKSSSPRPDAVDGG